jgi:hypothetical protein
LLPMAAVVALKEAEVAPAPIVTEAWTVRMALVLVRVTAASPVGAGSVRVTVQALEAFDNRVVGLQTSDETSTGATRLMAVFAELPL